MKRGKESRISLKIAGGSTCVLMCPDCYRLLKAGKRFTYEVVRKQVVKVYEVMKAQESVDDIFFEVRTNMLESV